MKNNNILKIYNKIDGNFRDTVITNIKNMNTDELCGRMNSYAIDTKAISKYDIVCELLDTLRPSEKVVHLDPEFFESDTSYIPIDDMIDNEFKDLIVHNVLTKWKNLSCEEKSTYIEIFAFV